MKNPIRSLLSLVLIFSFVLVSCARTENDIVKKDDTVKPEGEPAKPKVSVMAYNIENFFDGIRDLSPDREDYTYLPLAYKKDHPEVIAWCNLMPEGFYKQECLTLDWNQAVIDSKVQRVVDTILAAAPGGPDVVIVSEIENLNALKMLQKAMPQYKTAELIEGEDVRGIDIGILSKLEQAGPARMNLLEFTPKADDPTWKRPLTRGIMEVSLKLPTGDTLTVLGFHFPSQSNPTQNRIDAINTLNKVMDRLGPDALVIAGGDSNVVKKEDADLGLRTKMMESRWKVSHQVGCKDCGGTHYYKRAWDFLDILAFSNALTNGKASGKSAYQLNTASIKVPKSGKFQMKTIQEKTKDPVTGVETVVTKVVPRRFDEGGVSDHMPIYGEIELR